MFSSVVIGLHNWRAALSLYRHHARPLGADPTDCLELIERLPHPNQAGPTSGWIQNDIWQFPIELLSQFQTHGLLAFNPIRLFQGRDIEPANSVFAFANNATTIIDKAVSKKCFGTLKSDFFNVDCGRIFRTEHIGFDTRPRAVGGQRGPRIAISWHGHDPYTQLLRHGDCHGEPASLERASWQTPFILYQDFAALILPLYFDCRQQRGH